MVIYQFSCFKKPVHLNYHYFKCLCIFVSVFIVQPVGFMPVVRALIENYFLPTAHSFAHSIVYVLSIFLKELCNENILKFFKE